MPVPSEHRDVRGAQVAGTSLTVERLIKELRTRSFGVLSTVCLDGRSHSVGVEYGVSPGAEDFDIYVMTRRQLKKARDIAGNPNVSFVVPLTRRVLRFLPPACIQFEATAEILDRNDARGAASFSTFWMGRRILKMYRELESRGETGICFLRISPGPVVSTYMVGHSICELSRRMEVGMEKVKIPQRVRPSTEAGSAASGSMTSLPLTDALVRLAARAEAGSVQ